MNLAQCYEEQDAWFSRADRFDGFDRGDIGRDQEYVPDAEEEAEMLRLAAEYVDTFVGPMQPVDMWDDIPF